MIRCPECNRGSRVLETRMAKRLRRCNQGHTFTTVEVVVGKAKKSQLPKGKTSDGDNY